MELNNLFSFLSSTEILRVIVKTMAIVLSVLYFLYSLILSRQVKEMDEALKDRFNKIIFIINSLQITTSLILMIFSFFLI